MIKESWPEFSEAASLVVANLPSIALLWAIGSLSLWMLIRVMERR